LASEAAHHAVLWQASRGLASKLLSLTPKLSSGTGRKNQFKTKKSHPAEKNLQEEAFYGYNHITQLTQYIS
jgi:hypothetical protein